MALHHGRFVVADGLCRGRTFDARRFVVGGARAGRAVTLRRRGRGRREALRLLRRRGAAERAGGAGRDLRQVGQRLRAAERDHLLAEAVLLVRLDVVADRLERLREIVRGVEAVLAALLERLHDDRLELRRHLGVGIRLEELEDCIAPLKAVDDVDVVLQPDRLLVHVPDL